jgi:riboflavin kinase/FMN adenylyltransferase
MEILWGADDRPSDDRPTVVTVGMFDGVHRGHRLLFEKVFEAAGQLAARSAVVTFDPHPLEVLAPAKAPCMLTTLDQRLKLFENAGFDIALVLPFNKELSLLSPQAFAKAALVEELHVRKILVGEDFRFGHDRAGDVSTLREIGSTDGFEAEAIGLLGGKEDKVSSSDIRSLVAQGDVEGAAAMLGHAFKLAGKVVEGDRRGRALGFPTANLAPHPRACMPGLGIYAGWWLSDGRRLPGAISVGVRPTFKTDDQPLCEIHILDFEADLYGAAGEIEFTAFLRAEKKFEDAESLVHQMDLDVLKTRELLGAP